MNKKELVNFVAGALEQTKVNASKAIDAVLDGIMTGLVEDGKVGLVRFGTFSVAERAARTGRNPQTGEEIEIPAKIVPKFKPSKLMKEVVAEEE